jgi:hypothetical protein
VPSRRATDQSTVAIELWELELVGKIAKAFRTTEREELEAELARKLCELKSKKLCGIQHWRGYVAKFLYNKASNIVRSWRLREKMQQTQGNLPESRIPRVWEDRDLAFDFDQVWRTLDPERQKFWQILLMEKGNQAKTARRMGKHRNTIGLWSKRIRNIFERHGLRVGL